MSKADSDYRSWRSLTADEYVSRFPARPPSLRKIARLFKTLGASREPFTMDERKMAKLAGVSLRTLQRRLPLFENYGLVEIKRWRYRRIGACSNTYLVFLGAALPENWKLGSGKYPFSQRQTAKRRRDEGHMPLMPLERFLA